MTGSALSAPRGTRRAQEHVGRNAPADTSESEPDPEVEDAALPEARGHGVTHSVVALRVRP